MIVFHTINIAICHRLGEYKNVFARGRLWSVLCAEKFQDYKCVLSFNQGGIK
jgi:hypothetical protein